MTLRDGDRADPFDVWTRVLTSDQWRPDGRLHNGAFSGKSFLRDAPSGRPWAQEVSGALLSLINDLRAECETFCQKIPGLEFNGVMYQNVSNLQSEGDHYPGYSFFPSGVHFTPIRPDNPAHADLVTQRKTDASAKEVRDWLQDMIQAVKPEKLAALCALRGSPNFPKS
jgi:hypothetical protein